MRLCLAASCMALAAWGAHAQISVTDQRGKTVVLPAPVQRIATIPIPAASMLVATDGNAGRLAAMHPSSMAAAREGLLSKLYPALLGTRTDIIRGGQFQPNLETLLALRTDLVFQWADRGSELTAPMEAAGLRVLGMTYGTQADLEGAFAMMGAALAKPDKARQINEAFAAKRSQLQAVLKELTERERPKVLYLLRHVGGLRVAGAGSYMDFAIRLAGGRNAAVGVKGSGVQVNFEQVVAWAPEVVLIGGFDEASPALLLHEPKWAAVPAVRETRVYKMPLGGYRWDPPSQESALGWTWLAKLLHPTRVRSDLRAEIRALYKMLYDAPVDHAAMDAILRIAVNQRSRDYTRLFARRRE